MIEFVAFQKIARLSREMIITEKLDGTNAQIIIEPDNGDPPPPEATLVMKDNIRYYMAAASRTRLICPGKTTDNYGFARWMIDNSDELIKLGPGRHYGEWWGKDIQRGYGLEEKRFSLFNIGRWREAYEVRLTGYENNFPKCCHVVPILYKGVFDTSQIALTMIALKEQGSSAAPGFMNPEGVVVFHTHNGATFKKTFEKDNVGKDN